MGDDDHRPTTGFLWPCSKVCAMTLRRSFRPLRPDLDKFLFARVGDEVDGIPVSVISALTCLGLDPWKEADRLSSLSTREAAEQLARLAAEIPGMYRSLREARERADCLVRLLPKHDPNRISASQVQIRLSFRRASHPRLFQFWVACFVLVAALLVSALVHGGFPFGIGSP